MRCEDDLFVITNKLKRDLHGLVGDISNLKRIIDNCKISGEKLRFNHYFILMVTQKILFTVLVIN